MRAYVILRMCIRQSRTGDRSNRMLDIGSDIVFQITMNEGYQNPLAPTVLRNNNNRVRRRRRLLLHLLLFRHIRSTDRLRVYEARRQRRRRIGC